MMKRGFVLDTSVTMAWVLKDESSTYADAIKQQLASLEIHVPSLWLLEIANTLIVCERRKRIAMEDSVLFLEYLRNISIRIDTETSVRAWSETLHLARNYQLSAYDASYLELALRRRLPLATLDKTLHNAAKNAGVTILE